MTQAEQEEWEVLSTSGTHVADCIGEARDAIGQVVGERVVGNDDDADVDPGVDRDRIVQVADVHDEQVAARGELHLDVVAAVKMRKN